MQSIKSGFAECRLFRVVLQTRGHMAEVQTEQYKARLSFGHRAQIVCLLRQFVCFLCLSVCFLCLFVCLFCVSQELQALQCKGSGVN